MEPDREQISQAEGDPVGEAELYFPAGQRVHDDALEPETDPNAQNVHLQELYVEFSEQSLPRIFRPSVEKVPASQ